MDSDIPGSIALRNVLLRGQTKEATREPAWDPTAEIPLSFNEARLSSSLFKGITYKILNYEACVFQSNSREIVKMKF